MRRFAQTFPGHTAALRAGDRIAVDLPGARALDENFDIEGGLTVGLELADGVIEHVTVSSRRMTGVSRLFPGRGVEEVLSWVPTLFSLCAHAQASAAAGAAECALGIAAHPTRQLARRALVAAETAQEHLWRVFLDWPMPGIDPADRSFAAASRRILPPMSAALGAGGDLFGVSAASRPVDLGPVRSAAADLERVLEEGVFGMPTGAWLGLDAAGFAAWTKSPAHSAPRAVLRVLESGLAAAGAVDAAFLPELDASDLARVLGGAGAAAFAARPMWSGRTWETTALSRQYAHHLVHAAVDRHGFGLLARMIARLVELALIPARLRAMAIAEAAMNVAPVQLPKGCGLVQLEAARGRLIHYIETRMGRVLRYRIVAPTEWNFHPGGVLVRSLTRLPAVDAVAARETAALIIQAIDPCVRCDIEVERAA